MINALNCGFVADDPAFDNTIKLNELAQTLDADKTVHFPSGNYYFNTRPSQITSKINMIGDGINGTAFIRNYTEPTADRGLLDITATCRIENISFHSGAGTSGGSAVTFRSPQASSSILRDSYITTLGTGGGTWACGIVLWGLGLELGVRSVLLDNVEIFACTSHLFWFVNARGCTARVNGYPSPAGFGCVSHGTIQGAPSGLPAPNNLWKSDNIQIQTRYLTALYAYDAVNLTVLGMNNTTIVKSGAWSNCRAV